MSAERVTERERFEEMLEHDGLLRGDDFSLSLQRTETGYFDGDVDTWWHIWQAALTGQPGDWQKVKFAMSAALLSHADWVLAEHLVEGRRHEKEIERDGAVAELEAAIRAYAGKAVECG